MAGAAGFIGSALCEYLAKRGWDVLGIDNLNDYYPVSLKKARLQRMGIPTGKIDGTYKVLKSKTLPAFSFIKADATDREVMENIFSDYRPDTVMNLAAQAGVRYSIENPYTYIKNNVEGFLVLLECMRHWPVRRFVYASSSSVYGGNEKVPFAEYDRVDNPVSLYAATKKSNELMARAYHNLYGIPAIGLRFFTVYGPWGRPDMAPMLFADAIMNGGTIKVFNNGNLSRDFTYIDDIVEGITKVLESDKYDPSRDIYNIGHGSPVNLKNFISLLERELGKEADKEYLPMQKGDVYITFADTSRLKEDYDYYPGTEFEAGIKKFAEWFKDTYRKEVEENQ